MTLRKSLCVILLAFSLVACGGGDNKTTATPSTGSGYPAPQQPLPTSTPAAYPTP
ncbi:MAG: hypothetical protein ACT4QE_19980 [Anaerolineales bacterium]